jgi:uncharacterized protein YegL
MAELGFRTNEENPNPRLACTLLLDTSYSMNGSENGHGGPTPIGELNAGYELFCEEIKADDRAKKSVEVAVVTFGGVARVAVDFTEGMSLTPTAFTAEGNTPMGAALDIAVDELTRQKQAYRDAGLLYHRPWIFLISDGAPTDDDVFERAAARVRQLEEANGVIAFAVGVGETANYSQLAKISTERTPLPLKGLAFRELFRWLSSSMTRASQEKAPSAPGSASGDDEQVEFQFDPASWSGVKL